MRTGTFLLVGLAVLVVVSAVEPATDEVSAATDASIVAAKAATKKALRAVKAHKDTKETDADDEQSVLKEIMNMGGQARRWPPLDLLLVLATRARRARVVRPVRPEALICGTLRLRATSVVATTRS